MTDAAPPSEGLVAGKYELLRRIGQGGMGSVWEARHVSLGTSAAIKFIEAEHAGSEEARSRFDREAKAAATIQSRHAIQIFDHGVTDDGRPYIVMELLEGEPLERRIERLGRMPLADTANIILQVCRGLARAHAQGIVHRDLKPENIFLVRPDEEEEELAKILDFGIAKVQPASAGAAVTSSTKTGAVLGTPFYMSPEQARGLRTVDHRTDLWSLGVIVFRCVTGQLPFEGESLGDLLVNICVAPIPAPSSVVPGLSPELDAWFFRALDRDPERRFSSVTELSDALAFVAGLPARSGHAAATSRAGGALVGAPASSVVGSDAAPWRESRARGPGAAAPAAYGAGTHAPLTSERAPGATKPRGKLIAGAVVATVLGATTAGALLLRTAATAESGSTSNAAASPRSEVSTAAPEPKAAEPPQVAPADASAPEPPTENAPGPRAGAAPPATAPEPKPGAAPAPKAQATNAPRGRAAAEPARRSTPIAGGEAKRGAGPTAAPGTQPDGGKRAPTTPPTPSDIVGY